MARNIIETIMGAVVLLVAGGFLVFAFQKSAVKDVNGYHIKARFSDVSGIGLGSDVRIGGMKVGVVQAIELDPKTYQAEVSFEIRDEIELPKDSSAAACLAINLLSWSRAAPKKCSKMMVKSASPSLRFLSKS